MIIIRELFIAKPGKASTLASLMAEVMPKSKVMTDLTGVFNKVVVETEMKDLSAFEARMEEYKNDKASYKKMAGYTELYQSGKREVYQIVSAK